MAKHRRFQQRLGRGVHRIPSYSSLHPTIRKVIDNDAREFNVSRSFVMSTALADYFGIKMEERYDESDLEFEFSKKKGKERKKDTKA